MARVLGPIVAVSVLYLTHAITLSLGKSGQLTATLLGFYNQLLTNGR